MLITLSFTQSFSSEINTVICAVEFLAVISVGMIILSKNNKKSTNSISEIRDELLSNGHLKEFTFRGYSFFQVNEVEDEGPHYFIDIGDGKTLYLNGQYLYDIVDLDFPRSNIVIAYNDKDNYVLEVISNGIDIPRIHPTIDFRKSYFKNDASIFEDLQIINSPIEKVILQLLSDN
jgi:hypothetical protein